uniref:Non-structural maintenance of chromosomes element 4 n=1 Tax=Kalanchoe fedtschenkoi TaxID=63787 RepID=A0A7N0TK18_KALFE
MARAAETDRLRAVKREARLRTVKWERVSKDAGGDETGGDEVEEWLRAVKRRRVSKRTGGGERGGEEVEEERVRAVKRERASPNAGDREEPRRRNGEESEGEDMPGGGGDIDRRELRFMYMAVKNVINDEKDDLNKPDSDKFRAIFQKVESLHQHVRKPREQVADAEAFMGICTTLVSSVKSHSNGGLTPKDFITEVSRTCTGCCTTLGPMDTELKQRRVITRTRRDRPTQSVRPEELQSNGDEEQTDIDKNMVTMFSKLRKNKLVRLEQLILNRKSFAQTVENLFALSFRVKDGRAQINVDGKGSHFISPKNAPAANLVTSKEVTYSHFILRMDFSDWKFMMDMVPDGEEFMPHRDPSDSILSSQEQHSAQIADTQQDYSTTPIRKFSVNTSSYELKLMKQYGFAKYIDCAQYNALFVQ